MEVSPNPEPPKTAEAAGERENEGVNMFGGARHHVGESTSRLLPRVAGALGIAALVFTVACSEEGTAPERPGDLSLIIISDPTPSGQVGQELPDPLIVQAVANPDCAPQPNTCIGVPGVTVQWKVLQGGGRLFVDNSSTDADGKAYNFWTLGFFTSQAQVVEARAIVNGEKQMLGTFTAIPTAGPPTTITIFTGDEQSFFHGSAVGPLTVRVRDQFGNPVPNLDVTFAVATGGGNFGAPGNTTNTVLTNSLGRAAQSGWVIESTPCRNTVTATADGLAAGVIFTATALDCWFAVRSMITPRTFLGAGVVNGVLYAVGGSAGNNASDVSARNEAYFPSVDAWVEREPMPGGGREGLAVAVNGSKLYAVGGCPSRPNNTSCQTPLGRVEEYDAGSNTWTTKASLNKPRAYLGAGVIDGILYAVGGNDANGALAVVEKLDLNDPNAAWTEITSDPLPGTRDFLTVSAIGGKLYVVGGVSGGGLTLDRVDVFDPVALAGTRWSQDPILPTARNSLGAGVVGGTLFAVGGSTTNVRNSPPSAVATVNCLFPGGGWGTFSPIPTMTPRFGLAAGVILDAAFEIEILYAVGGSQDGTTISGAVEAYTALCD